MVWRCQLKQFKQAPRWTLNSQLRHGWGERGGEGEGGGGGTRRHRHSCSVQYFNTFDTTVKRIIKQQGRPSELHIAFSPSSSLGTGRKMHSQSQVNRLKTSKLWPSLNPLGANHLLEMELHLV